MPKYIKVQLTAEIELMIHDHIDAEWMANEAVSIPYYRDLDDEIGSYLSGVTSMVSWELIRDLPA